MSDLSQPPYVDRQRPAQDYTDKTADVSFDTPRQPATGDEEDTRVDGNVILDPSVNTHAEVRIRVRADPLDDTDWVMVQRLTAPAGLSGQPTRPFAIEVPGGGEYEIVNHSDPDTGNTLDAIMEKPLY